MPSFYVGQIVRAFFESNTDPSLNGYYNGVIENVIEEPGFATRYDVFYDDGDKAVVGSQHIISMETQVRSGVEEDELQAFVEELLPSTNDEKVIIISTFEI
jgi:hypothetical protein